MPSKYAHLSFVRTMLLAAVATLASVAARDAQAGPCKPDGYRCRTDQSCCGTSGNNGLCVKSAGERFGTCCTPSGASESICNGLDDDCDGLVDEDYIPAATTCGSGTCAGTGQLVCDAGMERDTCTPTAFPDCTGKTCGDDGCGGSCGTCTCPCETAWNDGIGAPPLNTVDVMACGASFNNPDSDPPGGSIITAVYEGEPGFETFYVYTNDWDGPTPGFQPACIESGVGENQLTVLPMEATSDEFAACVQLVEARGCVFN